MKDITVKDIAREVGVSVATVSYVLNNNTKQKISDATREAILEAAESLGYVPNANAQSLRGGGTKCISLVSKNAFSRSRFSLMLNGVQEYLNSLGYWVMLFDVEADEECPKYIDSVLKRRSEGVIFFSPDGMGPCEEHTKLLIEHKIPFVALDCCPDEEELPSVSFDYERGAYEVASRLCGEGAKKLVFWDNNILSYQSQYRMDGINKALEAYPACELHHFPIDNYKPSTYVDERTRFMDIYHTCEQYLSEKIIPMLDVLSENDAFICSWDVMASCLTSILIKRNQKVKIALLNGLHPDIPNSKLLISQANYYKGGEMAAKMLIDIINDIRLEDTRPCLPPVLPVYIDF